MIKFTKIISGKTTDKWLTKCDAGAQSHLGCIILLHTKYLGEFKMLYAEMVRHESIHILQARELLVIFWYLMYGFNFIWAFSPKLCKIMLLKDSYTSFSLFKKMIMVAFWVAYKEIIFEIEAYAHDKEEEYLKTRKVFACFRDIK